jgi:hypothetical protein
MPAIKAIETRYAGCRFRSRLEARWAVFFDRLGLAWQYEPEGFEAKPYEDTPPFRYLPDFYLTDTETWVEVKGSDDHADWELLANMVDYGSPMPGVHESFGSTRGLLLLGPIPHVDPPNLPMWSILQHHKGIGLFNASFCDYGLRVAEDSVDETSAPTIPKGTSFECRWWQTESYGRAWMRKTARAYEAARSARFEHGERGASWR